MLLNLVLVQDFDGHDALVFGVDGTFDFAKRAFAQGFADFILANWMGHGEEREDRVRTETRGEKKKKERMKQGEEQWGDVRRDMGQERRTGKGTARGRSWRGVGVVCLPFFGIVSGV